MKRRIYPVIIIHSDGRTRSEMRINNGRLPNVSYPPLGAEEQATFLDRGYQPGWIPAGVCVYRYGSNPSQAIWSRRSWVNVTTDRFDFTDEAIEWCSLLDATMKGLHADGVTGVWNTAAWRCCLTALKPVPVYHGIVAPLGFDLYTAKVYRGPGDQIPHRTTSGGAVQILVPVSERDSFTQPPPVSLQPTRLPV